MKVAIVHDWMTLRGGGESCVEEFMQLFPDADLFTLVEGLPDDERGFLAGRRLTTSFIQRLPWARTRHRMYLPLMPLAVEQFDMTGYDLVISTSSAIAKGVITGPDQVHIAYTFSPIRYAWDLQHSYLRESGMGRGIRGLIARLVLHYIRIWDVRTAPGVDRFVAISHFIARRIRKVYGRDAVVVYPPVALDRFPLNEGARDDFYLAAGRMVPYKRVPMIAEAFAKMGRRLVVIGDGPDRAAVEAAAGPTVQVLGKQPHDVLVDHMRRCKAFIFAAEEDFGIAPVEAQACGAPVVAFAKGAALETIRGEMATPPTGIFFAEQTTDSLIEAVERLDTLLPAINPAACRANAERFSTARFREEIGALITETMAANELPTSAAARRPTIAGGDQIDLAHGRGSEGSGPGDPIVLDHEPRTDAAIG